MTALPPDAGQSEARDPLVMPQDEFAVLKAVARTFGAVATKPCGCGPDEPCDAHAEQGEAPDWRTRAEAAEATSGALRHELDSHRQVIAILVSRAGGDVFLSDQELAELEPLPGIAAMREPDGLRIAITGSGEEARDGG